MHYNDHGIGAADCDDTAIIINQDNKSQSLIVGTLKQAGLELYNLNGHLLQSIPAPNAPNNDTLNAPGRFNNVAVIHSTRNESKSIVIVIVSDRGLDQLRFYTLNTDGLLMDVTNASIPWIFSSSQAMVNEQQTAYGLTATNYNNTITVFVSQRHQNIIAKVKIVEIGRLYSYKVINLITLPTVYPNTNGWQPCLDSDDEMPQIEGMVVDPANGILVVSQEIVGVYWTELNSPVYNFTLIDTVCPSISYSVYTLNYRWKHMVWDMRECITKRRENTNVFIMQLVVQQEEI